MKLFWIDPGDSKLTILICDPNFKLDHGQARVSNSVLNPKNNIFHFHPISFAVFPFVKRNYNPSKKTVESLSCLHGGFHF